MMCEHCEGNAKPIRCDDDVSARICPTMSGDGRLVMMFFEVWRGLFGRPKYAHRMFDLRIDYCPMCGRKIGGGE